MSQIMLYSQYLSMALGRNPECFIFQSVTKGIQSCPWACLSWWATSVRSVNCEQSRALPCWPWLPASRCILGSCGCRLAVWQSGLCPPPPHDNPHFPSALPRLDTRPHTHPSWPYHHFPSCHMQPHVHLGCSTECGRDEFLNAVASDWGTRRELRPACCHSDLTAILAGSASVALWQRWQRVLVSHIDVGHQCLGMMRDLWLMI